MKYFITFVLLVLTLGMNAQLFYLTYGYNGSFTKLSGINEVVDNYNDLRPWLDKEMGNFNYLDGFSLSVGGAMANVWFDSGFDWRSQKQSAEGTDLYGFYNTRQLKVKNGSFLLNFGYLDGKGDNVFGLGLRTEIGTIQTQTRLFGESYEKDKFEDIGYSHIGARSGPMIKLISRVVKGGPIVTASLYYTWSFLDYNYTRLDEELNGTFYNYEDSPRFDMRPHSFGFQLSFGFVATP